MSEQQPDISPRTVPPDGLSRWLWLRHLLPFVVTAIVAVVTTLLIQNMLLVPRPAAPLPAPVGVVGGVTATPTVPPSPTPSLRPSATPTPRPSATAEPPPATADASPTATVLPAVGGEALSPAPVLPTATPTTEDLAALRVELDRLWSAYYLARSANQLADAEAALMLNDLDQVEQGLTTAAALVDRAYEHSAEQEKGPISEFRAQISLLREDARVRPAGMDQRLRRLRQSMLSLADAGA